MLCRFSDGKHNTVMITVYFCSRVLSDIEKRLVVVEKEALAIYLGITRLRTFLLWCIFVVYSDHKPLKYIFNNERCSPKILRWKPQLQKYNFKLNTVPEFKIFWLIVFQEYVLLLKKLVNCF